MQTTHSHPYRDIHDADRDLCRQFPGERFRRIDEARGYPEAFADAVLDENRLHANGIVAVTARVHQGAPDVLGPATSPSTAHQAKFDMGTVLGLVAHRGPAGVTGFERDFPADDIVAFRDKVRMTLDDEVDRAYPTRGIGKITVRPRDGREPRGRIDEPKVDPCDPGNTLSRGEIDAKCRPLAAFSGAASEAEAPSPLDVAWQVAAASQPGPLFDGAAAMPSAAAQTA